MVRTVVFSFTMCLWAIYFQVLGHKGKFLKPNGIEDCFQESQVHVILVNKDVAEKRSWFLKSHYVLCMEDNRKVLKILYTSMQRD